MDTPDELDGVDPNTLTTKIILIATGTGLMLMRFMVHRHLLQLNRSKSSSANNQVHGDAENRARHAEWLLSWAPISKHPLRRPSRLGSKFAFRYAFGAR